VITTEVLPATRWRDPQDVRAVLELPPAGVLIGADRHQTAVVLPAIGPRPTRLGVLGDHRIATLLAYRLLGVGCRLTVATTDPARWRQLLAAAGSRAMVGADARNWPPAPAAGVDGEAHLLVSDLPPAPPLRLGDRPLCTVVHVAQAVPTGSPFWAAVDGVVLAGGGYGIPLAQLLGRADAAQLDRLGAGQLGVLDRDRAVVVTPILAEAELALLTPT
jgi:hypothetical protein